MIRRIRDDRGSALFAALGVVAVLTILGIAGFTMATNNLHLTTRERVDMEALHVADSGMDAAIWRIRESGASVDSSFTISTDTGTADVTVQPQSSFRLLVRSEGHSDEDPAIMRAVETEVFHMSLWNFVMGAETFSVQAGGGGHVSGTMNVTGPFYARGNLDMRGGSAVWEGPLFVNDGDILISSTAAAIGEPTVPVEVYCDGSIDDPHGSIHGTISSNCPDIELPRLGDTELNEAYTKAKAESIDGKVGATEDFNNETRAVDPPAPPGMLPGYYKVIDADGSVGGATQNLTLDSTTPSFGVPGDDLAWDSVSSKLYVEGTVFVDGDLYLNTDISYEGKGTFIVTGDVYFFGTYLPSGGWETYPVTNAVGFATPNNIHFNFTMGNVPDPTYADAHLAGAWYAGTALNCDDHLVVRGSILSNNLNFGTHSNIHLLTDPALPDNLPPSLPGGDDARTVFITRWHEGSS